MVLLVIAKFENFPNVHQQDADKWKWEIHAGTELLKGIGKFLTATMRLSPQNILKQKSKLHKNVCDKLPIIYERKDKSKYMDLHYLYPFECLQINVCIRKICSKIIKPKNKKNYYLQGKDKIGQSVRAGS